MRRRALTVTRVVLSLAAIFFIVMSMVKDQLTPYLPIGMALTAIVNVHGCCESLKKKGKKNGSTEDRDIS
ncbi:MAG: hypothetical protein J6Y08_01230 [Clostridiales bacterium]|nr:hypothetical protein [Clostridiales bacterium]